MKVKRMLSLILVLCVLFSSSFAETGDKNIFDQIGDWFSGNWSGFTIWLRTITWDNPYSWIRDMVLDVGILAYDSYVDIRDFMSENPVSDAIKKKSYEKLSEQSLLNDEKDEVLFL